jgi:parallel beta-helix repeat protein
MRSPSSTSYLSLVVFFAVATPALATDGVVEINQACAVHTGCFSGDTAGLPVTIDGTAGHSYRLTSDLTVPDENTDGIVVSTSSVSIDLNGFEIAGPVTCSGNPPGVPLTCNPASGTGSGVWRSTGAERGISVKNGSITGMGSYGVRLGSDAEITNLRVRWNWGTGISVSANSTISGNTVSENGNDGIYAFIASTISGNTTLNNANDGIFCVQGCSIVGNVAYTNGDQTNPATDDGIECDRGCSVRANSVHGNRGYGLNLGADSAYSDNVVTSNATGTVTGSGSANSLGGNYCSGTGTVSASCP